MFEILRDDVGRDDIITSMCDDRRYLLDYRVAGHRSCRTNFTEELEPWGIAEWQIPDPFNFFQNVPIHPDRTFGNEIPTGRPGDKLVLRTLMDAIVSVGWKPWDRAGAPRAPASAGRREARRRDAVERSRPSGGR